MVRLAFSTKIILGLAIIALTVGYFSLPWGHLFGSPTQPRAIGCTKEAMACPDGSAVGRVPPRCEFAPCPATNTLPGDYSSLWQINASETEQLVTSDLAKDKLVYATASGTDVTVRERNLRRGTERTLFTYASLHHPARESSYSYLPGDLALSPDGRYIAYVEVGGLKVYDLKTNARSTLLGLTMLAAPSPRDTSPDWQWALPGMENVLGLGNLQWSADGAYLAYKRSAYEGGGNAYVNVATRKHTVVLCDTDTGKFTLSIGHGGNLAWAPTGHRYVVEGNTYGGYDHGICIGDASSASRATNYDREPVRNATSTDYSRSWGYYDSNSMALEFSPDGQLLLLGHSSTDEEGGPEIAIANLRTHGIQRRPVAEGFKPTAAAFIPGSIDIGYLAIASNERSGFSAEILSRLNVATGNDQPLASLNDDLRGDISELSWTEEGYLVLASLDWRHLLVLDVEKQSTVYSSGNLFMRTDDFVQPGWLAVLGFRR